MKGPTLKLTTLLLIGALCAPAFARAEDGNGVGGGANVLNGRLLDQEFKDGSFDPRREPGFEEVVKPALEAIRQKLPYLADDLEMHLNKPWFKLNGKLFVNTSRDVNYLSDQMAYQDQDGIYFDVSQYKDRSPQEKGNALFHELVQGLRVAKHLRNPEGKDEVGGVNLITLSNELLEAKDKSADELQRSVYTVLKTAYATKAQAEAAEVSDKYSYARTSLFSSRFPNTAENECRIGMPSTINYGREQSRFKDRQEYFGKKSAGKPSLLHVPLERKAMEEDMLNRERAKLYGRTGNGFFPLEVPAKTAEEFCAAAIPLERAMREEVKTGISAAAPVAADAVRSAHAYLGNPRTEHRLLGFLVSSLDYPVALPRMEAAAQKLANEGNLCLKKLEREFQQLQKDPRVNQLCREIYGECEIGVAFRPYFDSNERAMGPKIFVRGTSDRYQEPVMAVVDYKADEWRSWKEFAEKGLCEMPAEKFLGFLNNVKRKLVKVPTPADEISACTREYLNLRAAVAADASSTATFVPASWMSEVEKQLLAKMQEKSRPEFSSLKACQDAVAEAREAAGKIKSVAQSFVDGKRNGPVSGAPGAGVPATEIDAK